MRRKNFQDLYARLRANTTPEQLQELADLLGLPRDAVGRMPYAYYPDEDCWVCAEVGIDGRICGLERRWRDGTKKAVFGGGRGLFVPIDFKPHGQFVLVPEGAADTAACLALGFEAVGRPNNRAGWQVAAEFLRDCTVLIAAENDMKPSGHWPGLDGAQSVARRLMERWGRMVPYCVPLRCCKDLRDVVRNHGLDVRDELRAHFLHNAIGIWPEGVNDD